MPLTTVPAAIATSTTSGWSETVCDMITGWSRSPSSWFTTSTTPTTPSATAQPLVTSATRAASAPTRTAPT